MRAISALVGHDEAAALLALGHRREARPAGPAAPQRRRATVHDHGRAVAGALQIDGLEVLVLVQPHAVEHVAGEDDEARAGGAERNGLALEIGDGAIGAVRTHHEHAGRRVHGGDDLEARRRAADAGEHLVHHLALHQRDVEALLLQHRHVLRAALGVDGLDGEARVRLLHRSDERGAIDGEPAAWRGGAEPELHAFLGRAWGGHESSEHRGCKDEDEREAWEAADHRLYIRCAKVLPSRAA